MARCGGRRPCMPTSGWGPTGATGSPGPIRDSAVTRGRAGGQPSLSETAGYTCPYLKPECLGPGSLLTCLGGSRQPKYLGSMSQGPVPALGLGAPSRICPPDPYASSLGGGLLVRSSLSWDSASKGLLEKQTRARRAHKHLFTKSASSI